MSGEKAVTVDSACGTRFKGDNVIVSGFHIRHGYDRRVVQKLCSGNCHFPACLEQTVRQIEAYKARFTLSDDDRVREGNPTYARSLFDERDPE